MKRIWIVIISLLFAVFVFYPGEAEAKAPREKEKKVKYVKSKGGLQALIEVGKKNQEMEKELKGETGAYEKVRKALDKGRFEKGEAAADIIRKYGEPVIVLQDEKGGGQKWVYKPAQASFWSGEKVYLLFDENDALVDWERP
ncbi:MAG: hypothetical protein ABIA77_04590 [Candidatus Omnitrophota bacterium]